MAIKVGKETKNEMYEFIDTRIKDIALNRRVAELFMGESNEAYDEHLNEMCDKWNKVFVDMGEKDILKFMFDDMLETALKGAE